MANVWIVFKKTLVNMKPVYSLHGFLLRFLYDLLCLNFGVFLSFALSFTYYAWFRDHANTEEIFGLLSRYYRSNFLFLNLVFSCTLLASGLYSKEPTSTIFSRFMTAFRASVFSFIIFILIANHFLPELVPSISGQQSSMTLGWSCSIIGFTVSGTLICFARIARSLHRRAFLVIPKQPKHNLYRYIHEVSLTASEFSYGNRSVDIKALSPRFFDWPHFDSASQEAVMRILLSGKVNRWTGTENLQFEKEFAEFFGVEHAIAVANGTLALELALYGLGIGQGDEVVVTCRTFLASASCIVARGAIPVLVDVDAESQNLTADTIRSALSEKTKAVICVHLNGWPCDMEPILSLAREHGLFVIEDCAQAHGACYKGRPVGSLGDAAAFSFCQDKIMTTLGEGGMVLTNRHDAYLKMWAYKDHGKDYNTVFHQIHPPGFRWLHHSFGTNWRLTEVQATVGRQQLRLLPSWNQARQAYADILNAALQGIPSIRLTIPPACISHAYYKYYVFVNPDALAPDWTRDRLIQEINEAGVPCMQGICGMIQMEKAFETIEYRAVGDFATARALMDSSIMFMVHPTLREDDIRQAATIIQSVFREAVKPV